MMLWSTSKGSGTLGGGAVDCFKADPLVSLEAPGNDVVEELTRDVREASEDDRGARGGLDSAEGGGRRGAGELDLWLGAGEADVGYAANLSRNMAMVVFLEHLQSHNELVGAETAYIVTQKSMSIVPFPWLKKRFRP